MRSAVPALIRVMLRIVLFDLDDTLYASQTGLWAAIGQRIDDYMVRRLGLAPDACQALRQRYLAAFGTTLNGLRQEYGIDAEDYLSFVHDLPLEQYLRPDPQLAAMLARLPLTKVIFTNADAPHARRVLDRLGVAPHFAHIVDIHALAFANKPHALAYARALNLVGAQAQECVFVDDAPRNLLPAHQLGMLTVRVGSAAGPDEVDGVDYTIPTIFELERVLAAHLPPPR